jgi:hypothetical protein
MTSTTLATIIHGVMGLAIVAASTTLLALDHIDGTTAMAMIGAAIGLVGGSAGIALALKVPPGS